MSSTVDTKQPVADWRGLSVAGVILIVFAIYLVRLFSIQILQGPLWQAQADQNRVHIISIPAERGIIYDRNGAILARNIASYNIAITPSNLPDDDGEIQEIYRQLSTLLDVPVSNLSVNKDDPNFQPYIACQSNHGIKQIVEYGDTNAPFSPVSIKCNVDRDLAMVVQEKAVDWPGVSVEIVPVRDYPSGYITSNIIGYLGPINPQNKDFYVKQGFVADRDKVGYTGVEYTYQEELGGKNGQRTVEWDVGGKVIRDVQPPVEPVPGKNIKLTIDLRLQTAATTIVEDELNSWNAYFGKIRMTSAAAIAMNPKTGEIYAMVSYPTYENNRMARAIPSYYYEQLETDKRQPLFNKAVGYEMPIGSVFKLVTATGVLNENVISPDKIIKAPGVMTIEEKASPNAPTTSRELKDHNWQTGGFGQIDFVHAIAYSSNMYFYKVGGGYQDEVPQGLGVCRLSEYARALGYGKLPGTGLPEEAAGNLPDPTYKRLNLGESWTYGDTYISSVGQGYVLGTPLQVLMSAATIATSGIQMKPTLLYQELDGEGNILKDFNPVMNYDLQKDAIVKEYYPDPGITGCEDKGTTTTIPASVFEKIQEGMRLAVTDKPLGTLSGDRIGFNTYMTVAVAGKTGTAEYCDEFAKAAGNPCTPGNWPSHGWTVAYAPFDNPEIAVVAFVYNGGEGASSAAPIIRRIMQTHFELKAIDNAKANAATP